LHVLNTGSTPVNSKKAKKVEKIFSGNVEVAKYLNIGESTLRRYKKSGILFKGRFLISNI
jgi:hypothetical protein